MVRSSLQRAASHWRKAGVDPHAVIVRPVKVGRSRQSRAIPSPVPRNSAGSGGVLRSRWGRSCGTRSPGFASSRRLATRRRPPKRQWSRRGSSGTLRRSGVEGATESPRRTPLVPLVGHGMRIGIYLTTRELLRS